MTSLPLRTTVCARTATPYRPELRNRRSSGRSHAHKITGGSFISLVRLRIPLDPHAEKRLPMRISAIAALDRFVVWIMSVLIHVHEQSETEQFTQRQARFVLTALLMKPTGIRSRSSTQEQEKTRAGEQQRRKNA